MKRELTIAESLDEIDDLGGFTASSKSVEANKRAVFSRAQRPGRLTMVASPETGDRKDAVQVLLVEYAGSIIRVPLGRLENAALAKLCVDALT